MTITRTGRGSGVRMREVSERCALWGVSGLCEARSLSPLDLGTGDKSQLLSPRGDRPMDVRTCETSEQRGHRAVDGGRQKPMWPEMEKAGQGTLRPRAVRGKKEGTYVDVSGRERSSAAEAREEEKGSGAQKREDEMGGCCLTTEGCDCWMGGQTGWEEREGGSR